MFKNFCSRDVRLMGAVLALLACVSGVDGGIINVPADFPTIQGAINAAVDGDEVVVANGTYSTGVDILNKSITLRSASNLPAFCTIGAPADTGVAVLGAGEHCEIRGIRFSGGLRGVEINAGASATVVNCIVAGHSIGGVFMNGETLEMRDSTISNNSTTNAGAGIFVGQGDATLENCNILNNDVTGFNAFGGGVHLSPVATLVMVDCELRGNTAIGGNSGRGGGLYAGGGFSTLQFTIMNTIFDDNEASERGGGVYVEFRDATFGAVEVTGNTAPAGGGLLLENLGSTPHTYLISNALIANNTASNGSGGGIRLAQDATLVVTNATIMANESIGSAGGGVANGPNSNATFTNCIVGGSSPDDFAGVGTTVVTYSNVEDGFVGKGNISALPLFVDVANGNYRLAAGSPCIDAGSSLVSVGPAMDLDGQARVVDDPDTANTGVTLSGHTIDMGAYEVQLVNTCPSDITGNGTVDVDDLLNVINAWGSCK
jgi:hypothetical protein